ncbi:MAG: hypothetical protein WAM39_32720 [Bryobacteraceae bacterium]
MVAEVAALRKSIRLFLLLEGVAFIAACLIHFGVLMHGYEHRLAGMAERAIGIVLLAGFLLTWIVPAWTRGIGIAVQAFALLGTGVGIYTIAIGIGPRTRPDITFHVAIVIALIAGLIVTVRARRPVRANAQYQSPQS